MKAILGDGEHAENTWTSLGTMPVRPSLGCAAAAWVCPGIAGATTCPACSHGHTVSQSRAQVSVAPHHHQLLPSAFQALEMRETIGSPDWSVQSSCLTLQKGISPKSPQPESEVCRAARSPNSIVIDAGSRCRNIGTDRTARIASGHFSSYLTPYNVKTSALTWAC